MLTCAKKQTNKQTWEGPNIKECDSLPTGDTWTWDGQDGEMQTEQKKMGQRVTTLEYTLFGEFECWNHDSIAHSQKLNKNEINRNEGEPKMEYKQ